MTTKHLAIAYITLMVGWTFVITVAIAEYHIAQELKNALRQTCQTMHDGTIICPPSYPDQGNDQSI